MSAVNRKSHGEAQVLMQRYQTAGSYALIIGLAFFSVMQMINRSNEFADKHGLAIMIIGVALFVLFLGYQVGALSAK